MLRVQEDWRGLAGFNLREEGRGCDQMSEIRPGSNLLFSPHKLNYKVRPVLSRENTKDLEKII